VTTQKIKGYNVKTKWVKQTDYGSHFWLLQVTLAVLMAIIIIQMLHLDPTHNNNNHHHHRNFGSLKLFIS